MIPANSEIEIFFFRRPFPRIGFFFQLGLWTNRFFPAKNPPKEESHQKKSPSGESSDGPKKVSKVHAKVGGSHHRSSLCAWTWGGIYVSVSSPFNTWWELPKFPTGASLKKKHTTNTPWLNSDPRCHRAFFAKFPQIRPGMLRNNKTSPWRRKKNIFLPDLQICTKVSVSEREEKKLLWWPQNNIVIAITSYHLAGSSYRSAIFFGCLDRWRSFLWSENHLATWPSHETPANLQWFTTTENILQLYQTFYPRSSNRIEVIQKNQHGRTFPRFDAYESTVPEHLNARGRVVSDEFPSSCGNLGSGSKKLQKFGVALSERKQRW